MISCDDYDYIEVACMYRYEIKLTMKSGRLIEGVAVDTVRDELRKECIKVKTIDEEAKLVVLDDVLKMTAQTSNPYFNEVVFN